MHSQERAIVLESVRTLIKDWPSLEEGEERLPEKNNVMKW